MNVRKNWNNNTDALLLVTCRGYGDQHALGNLGACMGSLFAGVGFVGHLLLGRLR